MGQERGFQLGDMLRKIGIAIKKNWILMSLIIVIFVAAGIGYASYRKPTYIAYEKAMYSAKIDPNHGNIYDNTISNNMLDTFIDFCDESVVVSRANYYYSVYENKANDYKVLAENGKYKVDIDRFIEDMKQDTSYEMEHGFIYSGKQHYAQDKIGVSATLRGEDSSPDFEIKISYSDKVPTTAAIKAKILVLAIGEEAGVKKFDENGTQVGYKYFEASVNLSDFGSYGVQLDVTKGKIIFLFAILGVAVSFLALLLVYLLDRTVRSKDELELVTGANVLAVIETSQGGEKRGRK